MDNTGKEITRDIIERHVRGLLWTRRLDELSGVMTTEEFDSIVDEASKKEWDKLSQMSKGEVMFNMMLDIAKNADIEID